MKRVPIQTNAALASLAMRAAFIANIAHALCGCNAHEPLRKFEFTRLAMGVQARIVLFASDDQLAIDAAADAFAEIARLEAIMSDYRPDSELSRLCGSAGGKPVRVSDDLFEILGLTEEVSRRSDGAFDVTIGPLVRLWREARATNAVPIDAALNEARRLVGFENLILDHARQTAQLAVAGMKLDLGGIGKGYAADRAVRLLRQRGLSRCMVALAGDIVVGDPPSNANGWRIGIGSSGKRAILLSNAAVSTSGDAEQFFDIEGVRYSHILDPRTGLGLTNRIEATVVAPRGELADALASAACVLGPDMAAQLISKYSEIGAIITDADGKHDEIIIDLNGRLRRTRQSQDSAAPLQESQ